MLGKSIFVFSIVLICIRSGYSISPRTLPTNIRPTFYNLTFLIDVERKVYFLTEVVHLKVIESTTQLSFHVSPQYNNRPYEMRVQKGLSLVEIESILYDGNLGILTMLFAHPLEVSDAYTLHAFFKALINEKNAGFILSPSR